MQINEIHQTYIDYSPAERNYSPEFVKEFQDCFSAWILPHTCVMSKWAS